MRIRARKSAGDGERRRDADSRLVRFLRRFLLIAVIVALFVLLGTQALHLITGNETLSAPADGVATIMTPIQTGFSSVIDAVVGYLYRLKLRTTLEIEYNNLKQENEQLFYQAMLADELQQKLSVYETLYDEVAINERMNPLVCTVIGRESGNYFSVFTINKGERDGVEDFMAVTTDGALVGYTYNVSETSCLVRTIIDSEASIAGLVSSSRDQGTVRGTLGIDGNAMCRMYYLPEDHLPRPGDTVVTSGVGMSFPKGIPIGTVRESTRGMESNKQYIVVEPQADFQHIEYVIVLRYQPGAEAVEQRTSADTDLAFTPLETARPVPTIRIGVDFYQLAPTPTASPEPSPSPAATPEDGSTLPPTVAPTPTSNSYEYQVPAGVVTENAYGFTLPPTATPTIPPPTLPPLELTVEEE